MEKRAIGGIVAVAVLFAGVIAPVGWFVYQAWVGNLPPSIVNAVGAGITAVATVVLAGLTAIYVLITRGLLETSQAQVSAMRASYAPVIDVTVDPAPQHLELSVRNTGQGTATNVSITVDVETVEQVFRYVGRISRPIGTGEAVAGVSARAQRSAIEPMSTEELETLYVAPAFQVDSELHMLPELLELLADGGDRHPRLQLRVTCTDVIEEREYSFTLLEEKPLSTEAGNLQGAFGRVMIAGTATVVAPPPESVRDYIELAYRRVRELSEWTDTEEEKPVSTHGEDLEVSIV